MWEYVSGLIIVACDAIFDWCPWKPCSFLRGGGPGGEVQQEGWEEAEGREGGETVAGT